MRVERLGEGTPEVAVVAGVHGDEPSGVRAVEGLLADQPPVSEPVKLVVANEAAIERGTRFVEADLNRSFPGDPDGPTHESRLAAAVAGELECCVALSLHATRSHDEPFAVVAGVGDLERRVLPALSVAAAVDTGPHVEGRLFATGGVLEVECGRQGTEAAAANAAALTREFLAAVGALDRPVERGSVPVFELVDPIGKPDAGAYAVHAENFERVAAGERFASADGEPLVATDPFYPVLLSAEGYADVFGYAADRAGTVPGELDDGPSPAE